MLKCLVLYENEFSKAHKHLSRKPAEIPSIPRNNYLSCKQTITSEVCVWLVGANLFHREMFPNPTPDNCRESWTDQALDARFNHSFTQPAFLGSPNTLHFTAVIVRARAVAGRVGGNGTRKLLGNISRGPSLLSIPIIRKMNS